LRATHKQLAKALETNENDGLARASPFERSRSSTAPAGGTRLPLANPVKTQGSLGGQTGQAGQATPAFDPPDLRPSTAPVWMGEQLEKHAIENHRLREQLLFFTSKSAANLMQKGKRNEPGSTMPLPPV